MVVTLAVVVVAAVVALGVVTAGVVATAEFVVVCGDDWFGVVMLSDEVVDSGVLELIPDSSL